MPNQTHRILNLGAGVQSTTLYLLLAEGRIPPVEHAVFADTGSEPEAVYRHLEWLSSQSGPPICVVRKSDLLSDLTKQSDNSRFAQIPLFTSSGGRLRRQCTKEYKIEPIEKFIRYQVIGLRPRQHIPKDVQIVQLYGISRDEKSRASRIYEQYLQRKHWSSEFPLLELGWDRSDCQRFLSDRVPHSVPRSACVFCPFHRDEEWQAIRKSPADWKVAVDLDRKLRGSRIRATKGLNDQVYLHRSLVPLEEVDFQPEVKSVSFESECEGMCGN